MKSIIVSLLAALIFVGCSSDDDAPLVSTGSVSFVVNGSGPGAGRVAGLVPEKLVVSVESKNGNVVYNDKVFDLTSTTGGFTTPELVLEKGEYVITKYLVISGQTAAYATPKSGAQKANLIEKPLPFDFLVESNSNNKITPNIVGISTQDSPQSFGYSDFGYNVPNWISVRVKLEITVGGIYYQNIDAKYTVRAYDESNAEQWSQRYDYVGPEPNEFKIKDGFHHYTISAEKWGKEFKQLYSYSSIYNIRVQEGVVPVTQVFQADIAPKKIGTMISYWISFKNGQEVRVPVSKTVYEYSDNQVTDIKTSSWDSQEKKFVDDSFSEFFYNGTQVAKIATYHVSDMNSWVEDNYTYGVNGVSHIQHKPAGNNSGITTDVDFKYLSGGRLLSAVYTNSNGTGFTYEVVNKYGSNISDATIRANELCSEGVYTYDKNVNPLKHLGYVDYLMRNYSVSNRLTESVDYKACAFPSNIPETYSYVYDIDGYPLRQVTSFKGSISRSEVEYTYLD